jgi:hypothetical protein
VTILNLIVVKIDQLVGREVSQPISGFGPGISALCQKQTFCAAAELALFN